MKHRVILTDCDGVLLNWHYAFNVWAQEHGYKLVEGFEKFYFIEDQFNLTKEEGRELVIIFNESAAIGFLPAFRDSVYYVKRLHEEYGFDFRVITSLSTDKNAKKLRTMNLHKLFGETVFSNIECLDIAVDKNTELEVYKDTGYWWIEDNVSNVHAGVDVGLRGILMVHGHNIDHTTDADVTPVKNWKDIYELITKENK